MTKVEMLEIMKRLDTRASALLLTGASVIDLLDGMFGVMPVFKALIDSGCGDQIEANSVRFPGLYRYDVMLSNVAEASRTGRYGCRAEA